MTDAMEMDDAAPLAMLRFDRLERVDGDDGAATAWKFAAMVGRRFRQAARAQRRRARARRIRARRRGGPWESRGRSVLGYASRRAPRFRPRRRSELGCVRRSGTRAVLVRIGATAYVGDAGRTALRLEIDYDLSLTQRLILQPRLELNAYGKSDPAAHIGSGLSDAEVGLRLRYEIRREIAPYIGIEHVRRFGATASLARTKAWTRAGHVGSPAFGSGIEDPASSNNASPSGSSRGLNSPEILSGIPPRGASVAVRAARDVRFPARSRNSTEHKSHFDTKPAARRSRSCHEWRTPLRTDRSNPIHAFHLRPLAACLVLAFSAGALAGSGAAHEAATHADGLATAPARTKQKSTTPTIPIPQTWTVKNCDDSGPDSLRDILQPTKAKSNDIVDLSLLPTLCGMADSKITLTSGQIVLSQDTLTLQGPDAGSVTISGGNASRVLIHQGAGLLKMFSLTIADGQYHVAAKAYGGCVMSSGGVYMHKVNVTGCKAVSDLDYAFGGGIWASADVTMVSSTVSANESDGPQKFAVGGGISTDGAFAALYSSISGNTANDSQAYGGIGGGVYALSGALIIASTLDSNTAAYGAALITDGIGTIKDATISGNTSNKCCAVDVFGDSLTIANSTIAFNVSVADSGFAAVYFNGNSGNSTLVLQSSIIAKNTAGATSVEEDLFLVPGHGLLSGADNLVMSTNIPIPPPGVITVTSDPKLGPLQFNGGPTRTRALLPGSPALAKGNNNVTPTLAFDQRGPGYPRTTGTGANITTDIGAVEFDSIFFDGFEDM